MASSHGSTSAINLDAFGHAQMGGVASYPCDLIADKLKLKARFDKPNHPASLPLQSPDRDEAYGAGAVRQAIAGVTGKMVTIERLSDEPYRSGYGLVDGQGGQRREADPDEFLNEAGNDRGLPQIRSSADRRPAA